MSIKNRPIEDLSENLQDEIYGEEYAKKEQFMDLCNEILNQEGRVEWWNEFLTLKSQLIDILDESSLMSCEKATSSIFESKLNGRYSKV